MKAMILREIVEDGNKHMVSSTKYDYTKLGGGGMTNAEKLIASFES